MCLIAISSDIRYESDDSFDLWLNESSSELDDPTVTQWDAAEVAGKEGCMADHEGIHVGISALGKNENGIFLKETFTLVDGEALTNYPGKYIVIDKFRTHQLKYAVMVNAFPHSKLPEGKIWILDASMYKKYTKNQGFGHIFNSCHPMLPPPFNKSNCTLVEESPLEFNNKCRPPLVFVVADRGVTGHTELLVDYHWLLNGLKKRFDPDGGTLSCNCDTCSSIDD